MNQEPSSTTIAKRKYRFCSLTGVVVSAANVVDAVVVDVDADVAFVAVVVVETVVAAAVVAVVHWKNDVIV